MFSRRWSQGSRLCLTPLALVAMIFVGAVAVQPAQAVNTEELPGNPLTIWLGDNGSFQELVAGNTDYSFFPPADKNGNAGFVLALPSDQPSGLYASPTVAGKVWGWTSDGSGPSFSGGVFTPQSQGAVLGIGTEGDPFRQVTRYRLVVGVPLLEIEQTATYVDGSSTFVLQYRIENLVGDPVKFRALIGADLYLNSSDCGSGVFKSGPPHFVGGTSLGRVGGFTEEASSPWWHYFEGQVSNSFNSGCQSAADQWPDTVWDYLQGAADGPGFPDTVNTSTVLDNGIGVQWDTYKSTALAGNATSVTFQLNTLGTVPGRLKLTPSSQTITAGAQAGLTATVTDGSGAAASGTTVRFAASGANSASGVVTTDGSGQAAISYKPSKAGTDTMTAFDDIDGNGVQGQAEPSATATVTVSAPAAPPVSADKTPPKLSVIFPRKMKRQRFLKGVNVLVRANEPCSLKFELLAPARRLPGIKRLSRRLASRSLPMRGVGLRAMRLRPSKRLLPKRPRRLTVQLRVTAVDRSGNRAVVTRTIRLR